MTIMDEWAPLQLELTLPSPEEMQKLYEPPKDDEDKEEAKRGYYEEQMF